MCIRDSLGAGDDGRDCQPSALLATLLRHAVSLPGPRRRCANGGDHGAVSYTHLRAHETVLDIVCRLLLEKKKKNELHRVNSMRFK